jgi:hypothetical protein
MITEKIREIQEMARRATCAHGFEFVAHGGRLFRGGMDLVSLKMAKVVESMERTIKLQLKLTPRRNIFAARTRNLTFCRQLSQAGATCIVFVGHPPNLWLVVYPSWLPPSQEPVLLGMSDSGDSRSCQALQATSTHSS